MAEEHEEHKEPTEHGGGEPEHKGLISDIEGKGGKKGHKNAVTIIAALIGIGVTVYLYLRSKNSSSSTTATTTPSTTTTGVPGLGGGGSGGGYGTGGYGGGRGLGGYQPGGPNQLSTSPADLTNPNSPSVILITTGGGTGSTSPNGSGSGSSIKTPPTVSTPSGSSFASLVSAANNALAQGPVTPAGIGNVQGLTTAALLAAKTPQQVAAVQPLEGALAPGADTLSSAYGNATTAATATQTLNPGQTPTGPTDINVGPGYVPIPNMTVGAPTAPPAFTNPSPKNTTGAAANAAGTAKAPAAKAPSSQNKAGAAPSGKGVVY